MITIKNIEGLKAERERQYKAWNNENKGNIINISNVFLMKLNEANLAGADLAGADLSLADLKKVNFNDANLANSKLLWSNLSGADFRGADLRGANLSGSDLTGANLLGANLSGANLFGANLEFCKFFHAHNLFEAKIKETFITKRQWDRLAEQYSEKLMSGFFVKKEAEKAAQIGGYC